ncbi:hypothetical protein BaRGS_00016793 [Batillaria attramentaria]|uniref:Uncharacterized protein n=1 Tax=Batillaria attramentaria TaxID=370345 RepID=A0ABD0KXU2_9CAEN
MSASQIQLPLFKVIAQRRCLLTSSSDTVYETSSSDIVYETSSSDTVYETSSSDTVYETSSSDIVYETSSSDTVYETSSSDTVYETSSSDTVYETLIVSVWCFRSDLAECSCGLIVVVYGPLCGESGSKETV